MPSTARPRRPASQRHKFTCTREEAMHLLLFHLERCRKYIGYCLLNRKTGIRDANWQRWYREEAAEARAWAKRLGLHFGKISVAPRNAEAAEAADWQAQRAAQIAAESAPAPVEQRQAL